MELTTADWLNHWKEQNIKLKMLGSVVRYIEFFSVEWDDSIARQRILSITVFNFELRILFEE